MFGIKGYLDIFNTHENIGVFLYVLLQYDPSVFHFISYLSYQLYCCALPDKRCLSHGMLPLSGHDDVALFL